MNELEMKKPAVQTATGAGVRRRNLRTAFELIRRHQPISQAGIASYSGMQPSTVSYLVRHLKSSGLVTQVGHGRATAAGGKRPILLAAEPTAGCHLGVYIRRRKVCSLAVDIGGGELPLKHQEIYAGSAEEFLERVVQTVSDHTKGLPKVLGVGVAVASIVTETGDVLPSDGFEYPVYGLLPRIMAEVGSAPAFAENDANCAAMDAGGTGSTLSLLFNDDPESLGAGLCMNGLVHRGSSGTAGELMEGSRSGADRMAAADLIAAGVVCFVDPSRTVLATPSGRPPEEAQFPGLLSALRSREVHVVELNHAVARGAADLAYSRTIDSIITNSKQEVHAS